MFDIFYQIILEYFQQNQEFIALIIHMYFSAIKKIDGLVCSSKTEDPVFVSVFELISKRATDFLRS